MIFAIKIVLIQKPLKNEEKIRNGEKNQEMKTNEQNHLQAKLPYPYNMLHAGFQIL